MKIAYATTFDARDVHNWSGTPFYMSKALAEQGNEMDYVGSLKRQLPAGFKFKQIVSKWFNGQRESPRFNVVGARNYSQQAAQRIHQAQPDVVIAPQMNPVAFLECKQPIVLWTDAVYSSLVGFYSAFNSHSAQTIAQGNQIAHACLSRCKLAIFSSDWAARAAIDLYGTSKEKVKVVPFGANMECAHSREEVQSWVKNRARDSIKLLFIGKRWQQKGGPLVMEVAKALHDAGAQVELTLVGCHPPKGQPLPPYVKSLGFISKRTPEGHARLTQLLRDSHFLFVPSESEAYGIVFCEANAFGLPALTKHIGGISTIVQDNVNGMTFAYDAPPAVYCSYIISLMQDWLRYEQLAMAAFNEYETRLNWRAAAEQVSRLIQEVL